MGMSPTESLKLRKADGSCCRKKKKRTTSLSMFMEAFGLEVEWELSTLATQYWAEGVWIGKMAP